MVHKQRHTGQPHNPELYEYLYNTDIPEGVEVTLSSVSERDSVWDAHRTHSAMVDMVYSYNSEFERYSERISDCSGYLKFGIGKQGLVLKQAFFCKVRYCPVCQWRKSLYWKAIMYQSFPSLRSQYPTHRFIFVTFTVQNPPITELRITPKPHEQVMEKIDEPQRISGRG